MDGRRRDRDRCTVGDVIDGWTVDVYEPDGRMRLLAGLKLPGRGWLEFTVTPLDGGRRSRISQRPHGWTSRGHPGACLTGTPCCRSTPSSFAASCGGSRSSPSTLMRIEFEGLHPRGGVLSRHTALRPSAQVDPSARVFAQRHRTVQARVSRRQVALPRVSRPGPALPDGQTGPPYGVPHGAGAGSREAFRMRCRGKNRRRCSTVESVNLRRYAGDWSPTWRDFRTGFSADAWATCALPTPPGLTGASTSSTSAEPRAVRSTPKGLPESWTLERRPN